MTWQVTVRYANDEHSRGVIDCVGHASSKLEATIEDEKHAGVFTWSEKKMPVIGDEVAINGNRVSPANQQTFFARINSGTLRDELDQMKAENASLRQYVDQLYRKEQRVFHDHLLRRVSDGKVINISTAVNKSKARENMVADFSKLAEVSLSEKIVLVADAHEARRINLTVQENTRSIEPARQKIGLVHHDCVLHTGDRVQCFADHDVLRDGDLADVVAVDRETKTVSLFLDRHSCAANLVHVSLSEYPSISLGYATTFERAEKLDLYQACIFPDSTNAAPQLVNELNCKRVAIYTDQLTAAVHFGHLLREPVFSRRNEIDRSIDPISQYFQERS
ncbi:MAG: hypothetical protein KDB27_11740 [Planctomycetales bacterium]|nr:hypothetical protein [Planctomycetales bacterium]